MTSALPLSLSSHWVSVMGDPPPGALSTPDHLQGPASPWELTPSWFSEGTNHIHPSQPHWEIWKESKVQETLVQMINTLIANDS